MYNSALAVFVLLLKEQSETASEVDAAESGISPALRDRLYEG
jgi:hypothetical protein